MSFSMPTRPTAEACGAEKRTPIPTVIYNAQPALANTQVVPKVTGDSVNALAGASETRLAGARSHCFKVTANARASARREGIRGYPDVLRN
jgi:hypothetical protein